MKQRRLTKRQESDLHCQELEKKIAWHVAKVTFKASHMDVKHSYIVNALMSEWGKL